MSMLADDRRDQLESYIKEHDVFNDVSPDDVLFYARFVNTNTLTSFATTAVEKGSNWVAHFYGDSAMVCAANGVISPKQASIMFDLVSAKLLELGINSIELVAFKGDINLFGSLFLVLQEKHIDVLETSLPSNLNLDAIKRRMENIKQLQNKFKPNQEAVSLKKQVSAE